MYTIASRMAIATMPPQGIHHAVAASRFAAQAPNMGAVIALIMIIVLIMILGSAARGLAGLLTELLRVATAVTSFLFIVMIVGVLAVEVLIHR
jgi:hypothetical protein